ncbi:hypothetical protein KEM52_004814 [Ascosphaera acerosa]|nr:hypothetical protein KEM52_004814 [Ascosphaera acerosa]
MTDLASIRAATASPRPHSKASTVTPHDKPLPRTPKPRATVPPLHRSKQRISDWVGGIRPVSIATTPDIPEPSSEVIDALHEMDAPARSAARGLTAPAGRSKTGSHDIGADESFQCTSFNETPPLATVASFKAQGDALRGYSEYAEKATVSGRAETAAPSLIAGLRPAPPATAPGVPTGPLSQILDVHSGGNGSESVGSRRAQGGQRPQVLCALNDLAYQPTSDNHTIRFGGFSAPDPSIGLAISTNEQSFGWEDYVDHCYESPTRDLPSFNWWQSLQDGHKLPADQHGANDRETFLSSSASSLADEETNASTARTSLVDSNSSVNSSSARQSRASDVMLKTSFTMGPLIEQPESSPTRPMLSPPAKAKSQEAIGSITPRPANPRRHKSSTSVLTEASTRDRTVSDGAYKLLADEEQKASRQRAMSLKDCGAASRGRILMSQPSPPPPMALPPIPTTRPQSSKKQLTVQCHAKGSCPSLAEAHPGEETPPLAAPPLTLPPEESKPPSSRKRGPRPQHAGPPTTKANVAPSPPRRRSSYSLFPTPDKSSHSIPPGVRPPIRVATSPAVDGPAFI